MVPGFNTDFKYRGETYHIQTEDNGLNNPVVVTLLYHKGAILASRKTSYRELAGQPDYQKELSELMKAQHKDLMRALLSGALDANGVAPSVPESTGRNPADAAAAVAARDAAREQTPPRLPIPAPPAARDLPATASAATPAAAVPAAPAPAAPLLAPPAVPQRPAAVLRAAVRASSPHAAPPPAPVVVAARASASVAEPPAPVTLDDAIRNYLSEFAAVAARASRLRNE